jgi:hypothetical protein
MVSRLSKNLLVALAAYEQDTCLNILTAKNHQDDNKDLLQNSDSLIKIFSPRQVAKLHKKSTM